MLGAIVPARTWFGAVMSILGVALLESSGSPPSVRVFLIMSCFSVRISFLVHLMTNQLYALVYFQRLKTKYSFHLCSNNMFYNNSGWRSVKLLKCSVFWNPYAKNGAHFKEHK